MLFIKNILDLEISIVFGNMNSIANRVNIVENRSSTCFIFAATTCQGIFANSTTNPFKCRE